MRIEVLGTSFTIQTDEDPEYVADIVDYYKTKVQEVRQSVRTGDSLKLAILSGLLAVDELFQQRAENAQDDTRDSAKGEGDAQKAEQAEEIARITDDLIQQLDESLEDRKNDASPETETSTQQPEDGSTSE